MKNNNLEILNAIKFSLNFKTKKEFINLHEPFFEDTNALKYLQNCVDTCWVSSSGNWVNKFEEDICRFTGSKHAIAVTNGTVGLRLALHCVGVRTNDEVIVPPLTFVASANAISHLGAIPHFIDINAVNLSISAQKINQRLEKIARKQGNKVINNKTGRRIAAIMPVHVFGMPANMLEIKKIADIWGIPIVEDAAEALGSRHFISKNSYSHCGLIGEMGIISFNGNKLITTGGGGIVITNNDSHAAKCRHFSTTAKINHKWEFDHDAIGWNDRMPNINAALGVAQLEVIEKRLNQKNNLMQKYKRIFEKFDDVEIVEDSCINNLQNNWLINLRFKEKDLDKLKIKKYDLIEKAYSEGIALRPVWKLIHKLKPYEKNPKSDLNIAEDQQARILSLPSSPQLFS